MLTIFERSQKRLEKCRRCLQLKSFIGITLYIYRNRCLRSLRRAIHAAMCYCSHRRQGSRRALNPIQERGHFVPPHLNHSISSKRLGFWSYGFVNFRFMYLPFRKVQVHQSVPMYVAMATMQLFWLIFENSNRHCFSSIST